MQGDAAPLTDTGGERPRPPGRGPRHAAPRKSLLSRLHGPAGKAMALAAMPTAVLMGISLTPRPAIAEDKEIPYAPGPCVTRSDEPSGSTSPKPSTSPSPSAASTPTSTPSPPSPTPTPSRSARSAQARSTAPEKPAEPDSEPGQEPGQEPGSDADEEKTGNPLDPLGLGDAIEDLLDGVGEKTTPPPSHPGSAEPEKPTAAGRPEETDPTTAPTTTPPTKPASSAPAGTPRKAIESAAVKAGAAVEELDEDAKGLDPKKDDSIPEGAKPRFPCATPDPEALAAAKLEPGRPLLPDDPWVLESSLLTLTGLNYHGIVEVRTGGGKIKKALKFTATGVDIRDLHQLVKGPEGTTIHARARRGSTSTIREATVTMYTEEMKGNLFGLIPVTFTPRTPPPVNLPFAFFTDARVTQAGQFGGTLSVPGLRNHLTEDTAQE
ncbi:hypothetical protein GCM10010387_27780 [Streptomyces inusitatus]|uniref:Hydrogenase expression protein HypF n=1 Tax=Streptomyces inusitatus TaxID=68221 RepID=A0A918Q371_9ACTN|nr:hypothetical protein [Streptomyces inusitatus]GGZ32016.1 hypothetical protein GCM10010387_27780 [Streptomyces inusitatus]